MVAGSALLIANNAIMKWLTVVYPVGELLFIRGSFIFIPIAVLAWRAGGWIALRVNHAGHQALRAIMTAASTILMVYSLKLLPLADVTAITFAGPLFITALAVLLLKETVGWKQWGAVVVGFAGVIIMTRPIGEFFQWAALLPVGVAAIGGLRDILTRRISATETAESMLCYTTACVALSGLAMAPFSPWIMPNATHFLMMAIAGILFGAAHYFLILAFRFGEAAVVAPFKYSEMLWAIIAGYLVWQHLPDTWTGVGSVLVIGSGIYIVKREAAARKKKRMLSLQLAATSDRPHSGRAPSSV